MGGQLTSGGRTGGGIGTAAEALGPCPLIVCFPLRAGLAFAGLVPGIPELLHAEALMVRVVAGEVAVGFESEGRAATCEQELFVVTHCLFWVSRDLL